MTRITPSERFRRELDDALAGVDGEADPVETIARLGARLILQQALEAETELASTPSCARVASWLHVRLRPLKGPPATLAGDFAVVKTPRRWCAAS